jgi:hypothetical protein
MRRWKLEDFGDIVLCLIVAGIIFAYAFTFEGLLFIKKKITIFNNKLKQSYDKVFHSISKVQKRERQR